MENLHPSLDARGSARAAPCPCTPKGWEGSAGLTNCLGQTASEIFERAIYPCPCQGCWARGDGGGSHSAWLGSGPTELGVEGEGGSPWRCNKPQC